MATVKTLFKYIAIGIALYVMFYFVGDFSPRQSVVLIVVVWIAYALGRNLSSSGESETSFSPFVVSIQPQWYPLLSDFRLLKSEEEWGRLTDTIDRIPTSEYNIYRSGILFTVISPQLTYWNNHRNFLSREDFSESFVELEIEMGKGGGKHPLFDHPRWANIPKTYFSRGSDGYELGLEVQADWWEALRGTGEIGDLAKVESHTDHLCGTTRLVIATLPYSEFSTYYRRISYKRIEKVREARNRQVQAHGWKREIDDTVAEIRDPWSHVKHKYFTVSHRKI